jgi:hypothetical protein
VPLTGHPVYLRANKQKRRKKTKVYKEVIYDEQLCYRKGKKVRHPYFVDYRQERDFLKRLVSTDLNPKNRNERRTLRFIFIKIMPLLLERLVYVYDYILIRDVYKMMIMLLRFSDLIYQRKVHYCAQFFFGHKHRTQLSDKTTRQSTIVQCSLDYDL